MNSVERIITALQYKQPDQVPTLPVLLLQGAKLLKLPLPTYLQSEQFLIQGQTALIEKYGHDGVFGVPHFISDIEAFGGTVFYSDVGSPCASYMSWKHWSDIEKLRPPIPQQFPSLQRVLKTIEGLAGKFKGKKLIVASALAPFTLPSLLIGTEKWMELLWEDELLRTPIMNQCLEICKDFCIAWSNAQLQAGADIIVLADGMASATCITRSQFEQFALPILQKTIAEIRGPVGYEPVGRIEPFIDLIPNLTIKLILLGCEDNIVLCKKVLQGKIAIMGNLNNIEMLHWTREQTLQKAKELLQAVAPGGGYIFGPQGPEIPWDTPDEVIYALMEAVRI